MSVETNGNARSGEATTVERARQQEDRAVLAAHVATMERRIDAREAGSTVLPTVELSVEEAIKLATAPDIERQEDGPDWATSVPPFTALPINPTDFTRIVEREIGEVAGVRVSISRYEEISDGVRDEGEALITISADSRDLDFDQMHALSVLLIEAQRTLGLITGRIIDSAVTQ